MSRTVYIELSPTPIYRRIALALGAELTRRGLTVLAVKPEGFNSSTFGQFVAQQGGAGTAYISTAASNAIQQREPGTGRYYFESFPGRLVFLHQDAILGGLDLLAGIAKLQAWQRVAGRTAHLCIEADNIADLASVGIDNARLVPHASEFVAVAPIEDDFDYGAAFVGHAVPSHAYPIGTDSARLRAVLEDAVRVRSEDFASPLEPRVKAVAGQAVEGLGSANDQAVLRVAHAQWLRNEITGRTLPLRGWVFEQCGIAPLHIFGGDPAYLHGVDRQLQVARPGVHYHPAVYDTTELQRVFNRSVLHVNLSSLQFDHAVVNRFHDVILSGGLCLTDARAGLAELTSLHAEVSYRTVDELRDRALHFARPENARERAALIRSVQQDVLRNSGYPLVAQAVVQALDGL